jgi:hypothetical protein
MIDATYARTATLMGDGKVLVTGGIGTSDEALAAAELYDPVGGSWSATGSMVEARAAHSATLLLDGRVLVVGGARDSNNSEALPFVELYDPVRGTWTATGNLAVARSSHTATRLSDGTVLVTGGGDGGNAMVSAELYNPGDGTWTSTGNMADSRTFHTATLLADGDVLVAGGASSSNDALASVERYDAGTGLWTATGNLIETRATHTATLLPNSTVLVVSGIGGIGGSGRLAVAELYNPDSGSWSATGNLIEARGIHTATLLPNGIVLVVGGSGIRSSGLNLDVLASAELYDPGSGTWVTTGEMLVSRVFHTATLLANGRVLVAGGYGGDVLASAELYPSGSVLH